jgi:hypothetical protein
MDLGNGKAWCREITSSTCSACSKQNSHASVQVKFEADVFTNLGGSTYLQGATVKPVASVRQLLRAHQMGIIHRFSKALFLIVFGLHIVSRRIKFHGQLMCVQRR